MSYGYCSKFHTISRRAKNFENRLRFVKVTGSSKVVTFWDSANMQRMLIAKKQIQKTTLNVTNWRFRLRLLTQQALRSFPICRQLRELGFAQCMVYLTSGQSAVWPLMVLRHPSYPIGCQWGHRHVGGRHHVGAARRTMWCDNRCDIQW